MIKASSISAIGVFALALACLVGAVDGNPNPNLKSELPAPEDTAGAVKIARAVTFDDIVLNNDKNVFVMFYAYYSGHCKHFAPRWEELAEKYKDSSNVIFAKMDRALNDVNAEGVEVLGFPTLYFFKANDKSNPIRYTGERSVEELVKFVEENSV